MKPLLIHNDNVPFRDDFDKCIKFKSYEDTLSQIKEKDIDILYIKDNLSSNYLELYGLRLAYHIRFEERVKYLPIVILSDLDGFTLNRFEPMARILFTKNIFLEANTKASFEKYNQKNIELLTQDEYQTHFLNLIKVEPPENSSNHSIANEWAIDRWGIFLGIEEQDIIKKNKSKISSMLYFKYLNEKYSNEAKKKEITQNQEVEGKILFIDDRGVDGWNEIIKSYVSQHYTNKVEIRTLEEDTNYLDLNAIKNCVQESIKKFDPHIILLDLRLFKEEDTNINKISGLQILNYIKNLNKSIQVIMFTASSDSLIIDTLHDKGILGYVKKDAPTDRYEASKNSFKKLDKLIKYGLTKNYLKEIWNIQNKILELKILKGDDEHSINIKAEIETIFEILDSELENKIKFTILTIFKVLEILTDEYYKENPNDGAYKKITSLLYIFTLNIDSSIISKLVCTRNFLVHSGDIKPICQNKVIENPTQENIVEWFQILQTILTKVNDDKPNS